MGWIVEVGGSASATSIGEQSWQRSEENVAVLSLSLVAIANSARVLEKSRESQIDLVSECRDQTRMLLCRVVSCRVVFVIQLAKKSEVHS